MKYFRLACFDVSDPFLLIFRWSDGTLLDLKNWQIFQPDTKNGEELCVQMRNDLGKNLCFFTDVNKMLRTTTPGQHAALPSPFVHCSVSRKVRVESC